MTVAASSAATVLLVPKSLTIQVPVSNGAVTPASGRIEMRSDRTPTTQAAAASTAAGNRTRNWNVRGGSSASAHSSCHSSSSS